jgi:TP901 family phage tail tape measure protein
MAIVAVLGVKIEIDQSQAGAVFDRLSQKVTDVGETFAKIGPKLKSVGAGLTQNVTAPIVALGTAVLTLSATFERAMNRVAAVTKSTGVQFELLEQAALDMGMTSVYSAEQAASALEELAKAGLDAPSAIAALPAVLDLATISGKSLADTATQMTDTLVQFGLGADSATRVADALTRAANASTIDVHQLGVSFRYAAIYASAFGMNIEDTAGAVALFGKVGVKADMAGTALRNVLERLANPEAHKSVRDVMKELGISTFRAADGSISLANALKEILKAQDPVLSAMRLFGVRAGPVMVKLVQDAQAGGTAWKEMETKLTDMSVTAKNTADTMNEGLIGTLIRLKNIATTTGIEIGQELQPTFERIVAAATKLAQFIHDTLIPAFQAMPQGLKDFLVYGAGFLALLGPTIWLLGSFATSLGGIIDLLGKSAIGLRAMATVAGVIGKAWAGLGGVLAIALEPWFWIPALIAGAVLAVRYFTGSWENTIAVLSGGLVTLEDVVTVWELLKVGAHALWEGLRRLGEVIWNYVLVPMAKLAVELYKLDQAFRAQVIDTAVRLWNALGEAITAVGQTAIGGLIAAWVEFLATTAGWAILATGVLVVTTLIAVFKGLVWMVTTSIRLWGEFADYLGKVWTLGVDLVNLIGGQMYAVLATVAGWVGKLIALIAGSDGVTTATQSWGDWTLWLAEQLINGLLYAIEQVTSGLSGLLSAFVRSADVFGLIPGFEKFGQAALKAGADAAKFAKDTVAAAREAAKKSIAAAKEAADKIGKILAAPVKKAPSPYDPHAGGTPSDEALKDAKKLQDLLDELTGTKAIAKMQEFQKVLALMPKGWKLSERAMKDVHDTFYEAMEAMKNQGKAVPVEITEVWIDTFEKAKFDTHRIIADIFDPKHIKPPQYDWVQGYLVAPIEQALAGIKWGPHFGDGLEAALRDAKLKDRLNRAMLDLTRGLSDWGAGLLSGLTEFEDGWKNLWRNLQQFTFSIFQGMFDDLLKTFQDWFKKALAEGNKFAGSLAGALAGAVAGFTVGKAAGKGPGIAAGAASGALVGYQYGSYYGAAIGAAVGAFAGWWGGRQREKEMQAAMQTARAELIKTFGGMEKLREEANRFNVDIDAAFATDDVEEFGRILTDLEVRITQEEKAVERLGKALDFTAAQGALMSQDLLNALGTVPPGGREAVFAFMQDQAANAVAGLKTFLDQGTIATKEGAAAISGTIVALYDELQRQGLSPAAAFAQIQPLIDQYTAKMKLAGVESSAVFQQLQILAGIAASEIGGPVLEAMSGLEQTMTSVFNLGLMNTDTFKGFAAEVAAGYKTLEVNGMGGLQGMQGMRGALQKLWELSQDFGYELTEQQQQLLDYAEAGGLIGDKFRPAADRMITAIDRLVERLDKFITKIADELPSKAENAAGEVEAALNGIDPKDIHQEYYLDPKVGAPTLPGGQSTQTALGTGGIVTRPTRALIGESGPEAVIPLPADLGSGGDVTTNIYLDGELLARSVTKRQPGVLRAYGVMR